MILYALGSAHVKVPLTGNIFGKSESVGLHRQRAVVFFFKGGRAREEWRSFSTGGWKGLRDRLGCWEEEERKSFGKGAVELPSSLPYLFPGNLKGLK